MISDYQANRLLEQMGSRLRVDLDDPVDEFFMEALTILHERIKALEDSIAADKTKTHNP